MANGILVLCLKTARERVVHQNLLTQCMCLCMMREPDIEACTDHGDTEVMDDVQFVSHGNTASETQPKEMYNGGNQSQLEDREDKYQGQTLGSGTEPRGPRSRKVTSKEPVQNRRNLPRGRRPPKKLSYHSVAVKPVSDQQKIEIEQRLWQEAKEKKMGAVKGVGVGVGVCGVCVCITTVCGGPFECYNFRGTARDFGPHEKKSNWALV